MKKPDEEDALNTSTSSAAAPDWHAFQGLPMGHLLQATSQMVVAEADTSMTSTATTGRRRKKLNVDEVNPTMKPRVGAIKEEEAPALPPKGKKATKPPSRNPNPRASSGLTPALSHVHLANAYPSPSLSSLFSSPFTASSTPLTALTMGTPCPYPWTLGGTPRTQGMTPFLADFLDTSSNISPGFSPNVFSSPRPVQHMHRLRSVKRALHSSPSPSTGLEVLALASAEKLSMAPPPPMPLINHEPIRTIGMGEEGEDLDISHISTATELSPDLSLSLLLAGETPMNGTPSPLGASPLSPIQPVGDVTHMTPYEEVDLDMDTTMEGTTRRRRRRSPSPTEEEEEGSSPYYRRLSIRLVTHCPCPWSSLLTFLSVAWRRWTRPP